MWSRIVGCVVWAALFWGGISSAIAAGGGVVIIPHDNSQGRGMLSLFHRLENGTIVFSGTFPRFEEKSALQHRGPFVPYKDERSYFPDPSSAIIAANMHGFTEPLSTKYTEGGSYSIFAVNPERDSVSLLSFRERANEGVDKSAGPASILSQVSTEEISSGGSLPRSLAFLTGEKKRFKRQYDFLYVLNAGVGESKSNISVFRLGREHMSPYYSIANTKMETSYKVDADEVGRIGLVSDGKYIVLSIPKDKGQNRLDMASFDRGIGSVALYEVNEFGMLETPAFFAGLDNINYNEPSDFAFLDRNKILVHYKASGKIALLNIDSSGLLRSDEGHILDAPLGDSLRIVVRDPRDKFAYVMVGDKGSSKVYRLFVNDYGLSWDAEHTEKKKEGLLFDFNGVYGSGHSIGPHLGMVGFGERAFAYTFGMNGKNSIVKYWHVENNGSFAFKHEISLGEMVRGAWGIFAY